MEEPLLLHHRDDRGVVTLTLNRPKAFNALSEALLATLGEAFDALAKDDLVRAVVLGASGKAFCAGHDLKEMRAVHGRDACDPTPTGAGHRARAWPRDCCGLPARRDV